MQELGRSSKIKNKMQYYIWVAFQKNEHTTLYLLVKKYNAIFGKIFKRK